MTDRCRNPSFWHAWRVAAGFGAWLVFASSQSGTAIAGFDEGLAAYTRGDYQEALAQWQPLAEQGDIRAQLRVGELYRDGKGVWRNGDDAAAWFRIAASQGNAEAQYKFARLHFDGLIVPRDVSAMIYWLIQAVDGGYWRALITLGAVHEFGIAEQPADLIEALKWYELAVGYGALEVQAMGIALRERVRPKMTNEQIAEAIARAKAWRPGDRTKAKIYSYQPH